MKGVVIGIVRSVVAVLKPGLLLLYDDLLQLLLTVVAVAFLLPLPLQTLTTFTHPCIQMSCCG